MAPSAVPAAKPTTTAETKKSDPSLPLTVIAPHHNVKLNSEGHKHNHDQEEEMECQLESLSMGPNPLTGIPTFNSHQEHREHIVLHMAAVFRGWARHGYTEGISGHISVRDPQHGDCIWMNPIGKHFGLLNGSDMVCLDIYTGKVVGGNRVSISSQVLPCTVPVSCG